MPGTISEARVREAASRILRQKIRALACSSSPMWDEGKAGMIAR